MIQTILPFLVIIFTSLLTLLSYILKQAMSRGKFYGLYVHCKISFISSILSFIIIVITYFEYIKQSSTMYTIGELIETSTIFFILIFAVYCLTVFYSIFTNYLKIKILKKLRAEKTDTWKIKSLKFDFGSMSKLVHCIVALILGFILITAIQYTKTGSYVIGNYGQDAINGKNMVAFKFRKPDESKGSKYYISPNTIFNVNKQNKKGDNNELVRPTMPYHVVFVKGTHIILKEGTRVYYDKTQNFYFEGNFNKAISKKTGGVLEKDSEVVLDNDTECVLADEEFSVYVKLVVSLILVNIIIYYLYVEIYLARVNKKAGKKQAIMNE